MGRVNRLVWDSSCNLCSRSGQMECKWDRSQAQCEGNDGYCKDCYAQLVPNKCTDKTPACSPNIYVAWLGTDKQGAEPPTQHPAQLLLQPSTHTAVRVPLTARFACASTVMAGTASRSSRRARCSPASPTSPWRASLTRQTMRCKPSERRIPAGDHTQAPGARGMSAQRGVPVVVGGATAGWRSVGTPPVVCG